MDHKIFNSSDSIQLNEPGHVLVNIHNYSYNELFIWLQEGSYI